MKTKSRLLKFFAVVFVALFALACLAGLAACGDETCEHEWDDGVVTKEATVDEEGEMTYTCIICGETKTETIDKLVYMTDDDVAALSAAATKTLEYEGSYTCSVDFDTMEAYDGEELTAKFNIKYSCDVTAEIEYSYMYEEETYLSHYSSYSMEEYTLAVSFDPIYTWTDWWSIFDIDDLSDISTVAELEEVMLDRAGYSGSGEDVEVKLTVSGGKYTMFVAFDDIELLVSVTVINEMVTNIYAYLKGSEDDVIYEGSSDLYFSYSYDSSLASRFPDLIS